MCCTVTSKNQVLHLNVGVMIFDDKCGHCVHLLLIRIQSAVRLLVLPQKNMVLINAHLCLKLLSVETLWVTSFQLWSNSECWGLKTTREEKQDFKKDWWSLFQSLSSAYWTPTMYGYSSCMCVCYMLSVWVYRWARSQPAPCAACRPCDTPQG